MNNLKNYAFEYGLILLAISLTITGFWNIYFGVNANPTPYQNFHIITISSWLGLLLYQLNVVRKEQYTIHRKTGLFILFMGPLLVASTALLSVHSAHKGIVSGEGDFLIVQNVMTTLELALVILLAFILKKKRKLHGAFLLSTLTLFIGIALFFTLISFIPQYKIEGPETFYRFETAGITSSYACLFIGFIFFLKDRRNGWPLLLASSFLTLNSFINLYLIRHNYLQSLTEFVGSLNQVATFTGSFVVLLVLLIFTGIVDTRNYTFSKTN
jgi:uncharacterized membrane protein YozB (DUF420 family)